MIRRGKQNFMTEAEREVIRQGYLTGRKALSVAKDGQLRQAHDQPVLPRISRGQTRAQLCERAAKIETAIPADRSGAQIIALLSLHF